MTVRKKRMIIMVAVVILCGIATWFIGKYVQDRDAREFAKRCKSYVGVWKSDDRKYEMTVWRVTSAHVLMTLRSKENKAVLKSAVASATLDSQYEFTYQLDQNIYTGKNKAEPGGKEKGSLELLDSSIRLVVPVVKGKGKALEFQGVFKKKKALADKEKVHLLENMGTVNTVPDNLKDTCYFEKGSDGKVERIHMLWENTGEKHLDSDLRGINKLCFVGDCTAAFSDTVEEEELENGRRKLVFQDDTYRYTFIVNAQDLVVEGDCQYLEVPGRTRQGDFLMAGDTVVRYLGDYEKKRDVILPEGAKRIASHAFSANFLNNKYVQKFRLTIPKDVVVEKEAFAGCSKMDLFFEEGYTEVPERAFANMVSKKAASYHVADWVAVTLPQSMRKLGKGAFAQDYSSELYKDYEEQIELFSDSDFEKLEDSHYLAVSTQPVSVRLNNGLEMIEDDALSGILQTSLPDSLKKIGSHVTIQWDGFTSSTFNLPENLEELGDNALYFRNSVYSDGDSTLDDICMPVSLRTMGKNCISGGTDFTGVYMAEDNPNFRIDEFGWVTSRDGKILYLAPSLYSWRPNGRREKRVRLKKTERDSLGEYRTYAVTIPEGIEEIGGVALRAISDSLYDIEEDDENIVDSDMEIHLPKTLKRMDRGMMFGKRDLYFPGEVPEFTGTYDTENDSDAEFYVKAKQRKKFIKKLIKGQKMSDYDREDLKERVYTY